MTKKVDRCSVRWLPAAVVLFSWTAVLAAQEPRFDRLEHLSTEHGLSHDWILALYQDHEGFLWIGTDDGLNRPIDNGNHLILSGNHAVMAYLAEIGSTESLAGPERAEIPFLDLGTGQRWTFRPGSIRWPFWLLSKARRVPVILRA